MKALDDQLPVVLALNFRSNFGQRVPTSIHRYKKASKQSNITHSNKWAKKIDWAVL